MEPSGTNCADGPGAAGSNWPKATHTRARCNGMFSEVGGKTPATLTEIDGETEGTTLALGEPADVYAVAGMVVVEYIE